MSKEFKCIHGLIWKTCSICSEHTRKEVLDEVKEMSTRNGIPFDFSQIDVPDDTEEKDDAYDIEVDN